MPTQTSNGMKFTLKKNTIKDRNPRTLDPSEKKLLPIHATRNAFPQSQGCSTQIAEIPPASLMPVFRFGVRERVSNLEVGMLGSPLLDLIWDRLFFWWMSSIIKTCLG